MDKLSGLASKLGGGSKTESNQNAAAGNEDYLDKGMYARHWSAIFPPHRVLRAKIVSAHIYIPL